MAVSTSDHPQETIAASAEAGLAGRVLLGWMDKEQAIGFLVEDCLFSDPLTVAGAEELWVSHRAIVESLSPEEAPHIARKLTLSEADLKATRKFRSRHPEAQSVVDFVKLNPMDLVVRRFWISTTVSEGYRDKVTPDKWLQTALLDPPAESRFKWGHDGDTIFFDLPQGDYSLSDPQPDGHIRVSGADHFVTVALDAGRTVLLRGYHRAFACAQGTRELTNAPRGVLFAVSDELAGVSGMMESPRPPRMADFFDERLFLPVTLRRRQYRMRIRYQVSEIPWEETTEIAQRNQSDAGATPGTHREYVTAKTPDRGADGIGNAQRVYSEAVRHYQAGELDEAAPLFEHLLFLRPDHADAHSGLGLVLMEQGKLEEAEKHCRLALTLEPNHVAGNINLAAVLARQGRLDEAAAQYERVLTLDPRNAEAHVNLGNIRQNQGQFQEAVAQFGRAIALRPAYTEAHFGRAEIKTFQPGDADLAALEALARRSDVPADKLVYVHYALAKAFADCGDHGRSFDHLRRGAELKRGTIDYVETTSAEVFERVTALFNRGLFDRLEGHGDPSSLPVFVVGMPRSGSTLIEQILSSHPQIHGGGELTVLHAAEGAVFGSRGENVQFPEFVPGINADDLRQIGEAYISRLPAIGDGQIRMVDKLPGNFLKIGLIHLVLPNARIVHSMRDPVDTCVSCYSRLFNMGHDFTYDLAELGRHYRRYEALMAHWRGVLPQGAMLDVVYEEVVEDLEGQARRLIEYCGLPWDDRCLRFHENKRAVRTASSVQVRQPLFRSSVQRWRKHEANLGPLLAALGDLVPRRTPVN